MQIWQFASLLQPYLHLRKLSTKKELFQSDIVCICAICIVSNYSLWWPAQLLNKYLFGQKGCAELTCIHVRAGMDGLCNFIILFILLVNWSYCEGLHGNINMFIIWMLPNPKLDILLWHAVMALKLQMNGSFSYF